MSGIPQQSLKLVGMTKSMQIGMQGVPRWSKYINAEQGVREQNTLQHSFSQVPLGAIGVREMGLEGKVDEALLITAFAVHDVGEGELGYDTLYIDKNASQDVKEYLAFKHRYEGGPQFAYLERAFLLQFCRKNPEGFPDAARTIMSELAVNRKLEANIFDALERFDYLLFGIEQYHERGNEMCLTQVLRHQVPHFQRLLAELPGFERLWTPELAAFCEETLAKNLGKWIEKKGEK